MEELSLWEKLVVLYENILDHPLFTLLFFVPIILFFLQKKHGKKVFVIVYFLVIFALLITFGDIIFKLFDNLMDGLFMFLYFPNFITLFGVVVATSLIALVSIFKNIHKVNKVINYISFGIIQSLFALILITVRVSKINIYKDNALYTNKDVLALMQLLIGTFALQILSLIIINLIDKATSALDNKNNFSSNINKQISNLSKTKIKPISIDNNKIGYINVADKSATSKPRLKPFKFDINKLESINFSDYIFPAKPYSTFELEDKDVSYYNEIIPKKLFNKVNLDYNKYLQLNVHSQYKRFKLENKDVYYLNEITKKRKLKPIILDSNKFAFLKSKNKLFNKVILQNKNVFYLNEIIKKRNLKPIIIDSNKIMKLNVPKKSFKILFLDDKIFKYANEINNKKEALDLNKTSNITIDMPEKKYKFSKIDPTKNISIKETEKQYNKVSHKNKAFEYLNTIAKKGKNKFINNSKKEPDFKFEKELFKDQNEPFDYNKIKKPTDIKEKKSEYDKMFNSKPDLLKQVENNKTVQEEIITPILTLPRVEIKRKKTIDKLQIIDIQSTLDIVVKFHLMKGVNLKADDKITVNNLEICNYKLLSKIIKVYKLKK